ncbi:uncharacterized protein [Dasypus novemcinctus]|uniref:uncharacterized protein n=1 Tax=Dasypus novemcinctus TaxID=9361 RepID=UPI0039C8D1F8
MVSATPVLEGLSSALRSVGRGALAEGRNVTEEWGGEVSVGLQNERPGRGPARGRVRQLSPARGQGGGRSPDVLGGSREVAARPSDGLRWRRDELALVQGNGTRVRGPSPIEEQHLPPGVEMGRNGPEHRPGSETPHPHPWSGRRAGRKSLTLTPPPFPLSQRFPSLAPPPLSFRKRSGVAKRAGTQRLAGNLGPLPLRPSGGGPKGAFLGGGEVGGVERGGGDGERGLEEADANAGVECVVTSWKRAFIYRRPDAISVFQGWECRSKRDASRHEWNVAFPELF